MELNIKEKVNLYKDMMFINLQHSDNQKMPKEFK